MIWYDFVVLAVLLYAAWSGAQRGLVTQLAWITALTLCFKFADKLAPMIEPKINVEQPLRHWIAMFILYIGFSLGSFMLARILNSWLEKARFKDFDRHLGGLLGLLKGSLVVLVITFFAVTLSESLKATVLESKTGYAACYILDKVEPLTPEYFHEYLARYREELAPIHDAHGDLGPGSSTIPDSWSDDGQSGGGIEFPDLWSGVDGESDDTGFGSDIPVTSGPERTPSFDEMWRNLPEQLKRQFGNQLQQQWDLATPDQKRSLVSDLGDAFGFDMPEIVSDFLSTTGSNIGQGSGSRSRAQMLLDDIGTIYQDRETIVRRTEEYFVGVPVSVQEAVIYDWHADLTMQSADPDPATDVNTKLDERILRQLDRSGVTLNRLSFELRQRLNLSRQ